MDFKRTNAALASLSDYDKSAFSLQETLALMRAIIEDITFEVCPLKEFAVSDKATTDWIAISRTLLEIDVKSAASEMSEKKQERLNALRKDYQERYEESRDMIENVQQQLWQAERTNEELLKKLDELENEKHRAQIKSAENDELSEKLRAINDEIASLKQSSDLLQQSYERSESALAESLIKKQSWERLREEASVKLAELQRELDEKQDELEAQNKLVSQNEKSAQALQNSIDDAIRQNKEINSRIEQLLVQQKELSEMDTQALYAKAEELERLNGNLLEDNTELQLKISALTADAERREKYRKELSEQINALQKQARQDEISLRAMMSQKEESDNLLAKLAAKEKEYRQALSVETELRRRKSIEHLRKAVSMYERIFHDLFGLESDYTLQTIREQTQAFKNELDHKLDGIRRDLASLNDSYLSVINRIEREVNGHDM